MPHVTIIRPCTGLEAYLYECLAATFHQDYPTTKLTISFCISSRNEPAYPVLQRLLKDYPDHDANIFVEDEDENLTTEHGKNKDIGPNPKIRNMSQAYRKAKGDIVWILDCNIWIGQGTCGRMVDKLCGFTEKGVTPARPYKLVAQLPIVVSVDDLSSSINKSSDTSNSSIKSSKSPAKAEASERRTKGGLLEQSFLSTAHAKFYIAINSVAIAPCINGKSTMFRRSHLNRLTDNQGIDYFGQNICEDHLIGDLLWKRYIPPRLLNNKQKEDTEEKENSNTITSNPHSLPYRNHGIAMNDLAIQPITQMSLASYIARRVRWLRVRKFTVPVATLVEPGTESFLCSAFGAWGATTCSLTRERFGDTWAWCVTWWAVSVGVWCVVDYLVFGVLQGGGSIEPGSELGSEGMEEDEDGQGSVTQTQTQTSSLLRNESSGRRRGRGEVNGYERVMRGVRNQSPSSTLR